MNEIDIIKSIQTDAEILCKLYNMPLGIIDLKTGKFIADEDAEFEIITPKELPCNTASK